MQCAHVSDVVRDNKLMIVGVTLLAKPASTLALICYEPLTPRAARGWITGSKWITRLIYSLSEISKKSILAAEKSLIFCPESDGGGARL